jgi:hypothetical protein
LSTRLRGLVILAIVALIVFPVLPHPAQASSDFTTVISVTPSRITFAPGQNFSVDVRLHLSQSENIGDYDVSLRIFNTTGVGGHALSIKGITPGTLFTPDTVIAQCVNGVGMGCGPQDGGGVAHSAEASGLALQGPLNATLFSVQFHVNKIGSEILQLNNDTLGAGSNPAQIIAHATVNGLFSNTGLVAMFNVQTALPLVNRPVVFNASNTFNSKNMTMDYASKLNYSWNFGDGVLLHRLSPIVQHVFGSIGNFTVGLVVTDEYAASSSYSGKVSVGSTLGTIQVDMRDQNGDFLRLNVTVQLFNGSQLVETVVKPGSNRPLILSGLSEGSYLLEFSGAGVTTYRKGEGVSAGWTTQDVVYLTVQYPSTPTPFDVSGLLLMLAVGIVGAGGALGAVAVFRRSRLDRKKSRRG